MKAWGIKVRDHGGMGDIFINYDYIETKLFKVHALAISKALFAKNKYDLSQQEYEKLKVVLTRCGFDRPAIRKTVTTAKRLISGKEDFFNPDCKKADKKLIARRCAECIAKYGDLSPEVVNSFEQICIIMDISAKETAHLLSKIKANDHSVFMNSRDELDLLVGLGEIKKEIETLYNSVNLNKERDLKGLKSPQSNLHFVFTGKPGTGKTSVARILANMFKEMGYLSKGHTEVLDVSDLVSKYVGESSTKTKTLIKKSIGGILFIDEAYGLINRKGEKGDAGLEVIEILLQGMENHRDDLIVIMAGYEEEMIDMISSNPGLKSRFTRYIDFPDFKPSELCEIFKRRCLENDLNFDSEFGDKLEKIMISKYESRKRDFGNARYVRNFFESCYGEMANRLAREEGGKRDLCTLRLEDLIAANSK